MSISEKVLTAAVGVMLLFVVFDFFGTSRLSHPGGEIVTHSSADGPIDYWTAHPEETLRAEVDEYIKSLPLNDVRFNRLKSVPYDEPETIVVSITPPSVEPREIPFIGRRGEIEVHKVRLSAQIEAELSTRDDDIEIRPVGTRSILLRNEQKTLAWQVTAKRDTDFTLELVLTNKVFVGERELVDRIAFERRFQVEVSGPQRFYIAIMALNPIFILAGGILAIVGVVTGTVAIVKWIKAKIGGSGAKTEESSTVDD